MQSILVIFAVMLFVSYSRAFLFPAPMTKKTITSLNMGIKVNCNEDEPVESMIRRFKRAVNQSGKMAELRFKEQWETAAEKKKRKSARARLLGRIERTNDRYENREYGASEYNS